MQAYEFQWKLSYIYSSSAWLSHLEADMLVALSWVLIGKERRQVTGKRLPTNCSASRCWLSRPWHHIHTIYTPHTHTSTITSIPTHSHSTLSHTPGPPFTRQHLDHHSQAHTDRVLSRIHFARHRNATHSQLTTRSLHFHILYTYHLHITHTHRFFFLFCSWQWWKCNRFHAKRHHCQQNYDFKILC